MRIAIIGLGCSGTLVLRSLVDLLQEDDPIELLLFESETQLGAGLPYGRVFNHDSFLLNMQTSTLGADPRRPREFVEWLAGRAPSSEIDSSSYVERTRMGDYLAHLLQKSLASLQRLRIRYEIVREEVGDIHVRGKEYSLFSGTQTYTVDRVILAVGHLKKRERITRSPRYIANPYHDLARVQAIPVNARVGVIGTKLTAVDIAILLRSRGIGQIALFSGSGRLPLIRGVRPAEQQLPAVPKPEGRSLRAFVRSIRQQLAAHGAPAEYSGFMSGLSEAARIERELEQAQSSRLWHTLLDESKEFIDDYWQKLSAFHKRLFLRKYQGLWMSYRHPMPPANARKIAAMLRDGSLQVHGGYRGVTEHADGTLTVQVRDTALELDYLIDASGTPADVRDIDSRLLHNLMRAGIVSRCEFGGIEVDPATHRLRPSSGIYAIGHLTRGRLFYVSALERLALHASVIAGDVLLAMETQAQELQQPIAEIA